MTKEHQLTKVAKSAVAMHPDALIALVATECPSITERHSPTKQQILDAEKAIEQHIRTVGHVILFWQVFGFNDDMESDGYGTLSILFAITANGKQPEEVMDSLVSTEHNYGVSGFYPVACLRASDVSAK